MLIFEVRRGRSQGSSIYLRGRARRIARPVPGGRPQERPLGFFHCTGPRQSDNRASMKLIPALAAMCALLLPRALPAESFEGKVSMKVTSPAASKDGPQSIDYLMKEGYMRMEVATARGQASMIMDFKNQQMLILMPQQRMYMVQPFPQPPANPAGNPAAKKLGADVQVTTEKDTILGYECTKIVTSTADGTAEVTIFVHS